MSSTNTNTSSVSNGIISFFNNITDSVTHNNSLNYAMYNGVGGIPYATFGMVGIVIAVLTYATISDVGTDIEEGIKSISDKMEKEGNAAEKEREEENEKANEQVEQAEYDKEKEEEQEQYNQEKEKEQEEKEQENEKQLSEEAKAEEEDKSEKGEGSKEEEPGEKYKMGGKVAATKRHKKFKSNKTSKSHFHKKTAKKMAGRSKSRKTRKYKTIKKQ